jgi:hypothetical protein
MIFGIGEGKRPRGRLQWSPFHAIVTHRITSMRLKNEN